jgi:hypothetical protein
MRAQRLNEVVSTDPMFANCRCFGPGWTGGQVLRLKSTKIDIIGFKGKANFRDAIVTTFVLMVYHRACAVTMQRRTER